MLFFRRKAVNNRDNKILSLAGNKYLYMSDYNQLINACIKDLFLEHGSSRKMSLSDVDIDEEVIRKRLKKLTQMTFEVTENCNLRCKYCVYNGHYPNWRDLSGMNMDFETAKKGLDYVFSFIKGRKERKFFLGFYGGEPLLKFKTIKKIVEYAKKLLSGWDLLFSMTSNLTLLDDSILDFLIENDFVLTVSLDGRKENHDAKRVFKDGRGTFDTVFKNLERIAARGKEYFEKRVNFSAVYSPDLPLKNLYEFYTKNNLVKNRRMRFTQVNIFDTTYYEKFPYQGQAYHRALKDIFSKLLNKLRQGKELTGYERFLYNNFKEIGDNLEIRKYTVLGGTCLFDERLYLDARGRFHVCERINSTFPFGDVEQGFDFKRMAAIVNEYAEVIKNHCSGCNIRFLCKRCYVYLAGNGQFRLDPSFCSHQRETIIKNLGKYIECKQEEGLL